MGPAKIEDIKKRFKNMQKPLLDNFNCHLNGKIHQVLDFIILY